MKALSWRSSPASIAPKSERAGSGLDQVFRLEFIERMTARNSPYSIRRPARTPVVKLLALVPAAAAGYVSSARRLESPIVPQCLANIDFAQRVSVDRSGLSVPPIAIRDPRNLLIPAVGCGDETIFRDLKFTLAKNATRPDRICLDVPDGSPLE